MPKIVITALLLIFFNPANAQLSRYIVSLKNKAYLSQRAIDRRNRYNIAIDSLDLPVTGRYIDSIRNAGSVTIINTSKWLNQVAIKTSDAIALAKINAYPFVMSVTAIASFSTANEPTENDKFFLENNSK